MINRVATDLESQGIGRPGNVKEKLSNFTLGQGNAEHLIAGVRSKDITVLRWCCCVL